VVDPRHVGHLGLGGVVGVLAAHGFLGPRKLGDPAATDGRAGDVGRTVLDGLGQPVRGAVRRVVGNHDVRASVLHGLLWLV
jgi:hypothetical protein